MQSLVSECLIFFTVFHFTQNKKSSSVVIKVWKNTIFKDLNKSRVRSDVRSILSAWVELNWNFESESKNKKDNRIDFRSTELCIVYFVVWITAIYTLGFSIFFFHWFNFEISYKGLNIHLVLKIVNVLILKAIKFISQ